MNTHILLINPWIYDFAAYDFWIKPVGLLSIGHTLEKYGYQTSLIDCLDRFHPSIPYVKQKKFGTGKFIRIEVEKPAILQHVPRKFCRYGMPMEAFRQALSQIPTPDVILVTSGMTYWYLGPKQVIQILRENFPQTPVILGGIYATLCYDHAVRHSGADYVVKGPGERAALKLVDEMTGHQRVIDEKDGHFPKPDYHHYQQLASLPILTSIGCPYRCTFCASHLLSGKFRQRNPEDVLDEIAYFYFKRHVRHFAFYDDALLIHQEKHLSAILDGVIRKQLHLQFHTPNSIHARHLTKELAKKMFRTNFKTIRISYETSNKARQQEMGFKVTDDELANALDDLEAAGFRRRDLEIYVIMGLPGQTFEEVIDSIVFVSRLGAKVKLNTFSPIPGTEDWNRAIRISNMPPDIDPLLTNDSIFPLNREDFTFAQFQQLKSLSKVLNYGTDHGINFFNKSELAAVVSRISQSIRDN